MDASVEEKYFLSDRALAHFRPKDANESIANTLPTNPGHRRTDAFIKVAGELNIPTFQRARQIYDTDGVSPTLLTAKNNQETPKVIQRSRGFNKGAEFELSLTISSNSFEQNNLLKSERIRKLTPRECLRLQGFPENFKIVTSDTQTYKQAGNAMSVNVVKMILEQIKLAKNKDFRLGA